MTWEDWARTAMIAAAAVFAGLADYRSRQATRYLRRVQQIRERRNQT